MEDVQNNQPGRRDGPGGKKGLDETGECAVGGHATDPTWCIVEQNRTAAWMSAFFFLSASATATAISLTYLEVEVGSEEVGSEEVEVSSEEVPPFQNHSQRVCVSVCVCDRGGWAGGWGQPQPHIVYMGGGGQAAAITAAT